MASVHDPKSAIPATAPTPAIPAHHDAGGPAQSQKSLRRKYQKIRWKFKQEMQASNDLIRDEHRSMALARRLQEQIDELQDLLLDINEESRLPPRFRFDIGSPTPSASVVPSLETDQDTDSGAGKSRNGRTKELDRSKPKSLSYLAQSTPHTYYPADNLPDDLLGEELPGYMTPSHEEEHLAGLDHTLSEPHLYNQYEKSGKPIHQAHKNIPTDKDLSVQNPDSAYNWLRRYQPQVFLQDPKPDHENASEKSAPRAAGPGRGKRKSEAKGEPKADPKPARYDEEMDEEVPYIEPERTGRGRKSKGGEDDAAYKPSKGGKGGKRKRDTGDRESLGSSRKKARNSGGGAT